MKLTTNVGTTYAVRSAANCTITTEEGEIVLNVRADTPCAFVATSATVTCDNDEATIIPTFRKALVTQDIDEGAITELINASLPALGQLPLKNYDWISNLEAGYCYIAISLTDFFFSSVEFSTHSTTELNYCQLIVTADNPDYDGSLDEWNPDWVWLNDCPALIGVNDYFFHLMNYNGTTYIYHMGGSSGSADLTNIIDGAIIIDGTVYSADEDAADNSNFTTAIIDGSRIPKGTYTAIELPQRIGYSAYPHSEQLYLIIQEATSVDDDGEDVFSTIAVSDNTNAPTWASTASTARWEFSDGFTLSGGNIKIIPSDTQELPTEQYCFGGRCVSTGVTGDSIIEFYERREQWRLCARFEGSYETSLSTLVDHVQDNDIHLSEMEQALLGTACNVISYEAVELEDDEFAISITPTTVADYQLGELTELTITSISIAGASTSAVATVAFWLTTGETAPSITWPTDAIWIDGITVGSAPTLEPNTKYRFALSQEPDGQNIISVDYYYAIPTT